MKRKRLDETDIRLIRELQKDARVSNVALARLVNLTEGAVRRRIDNLVASGALRIIGVGIPEQLGFTTHAVIGMRVEAGKVEEVLEACARLHEFSFVYQVTGQFDIMAVAFFKSNDLLREFLTGRLGRMPGVIETQTFLIMKTAKRTFRPSDGPDEPASVDATESGPG
jgi:Lrp/AsnC family transcriptional regulator for asnA, asnC and gidA